MTREEWLRKAVEMLDAELFKGDLDLLNHNFQINCGICPGKKNTHTIQPYDGEDVKLEDFFPTTISVNHQMKDVEEMIGCLARECVFAFFGEKSVNKRAKRLFEKYYFEAPFTSYNPSTVLVDIIDLVYKKMVKDYGKFPGDPVVVYPKQKKEGKKNIFVSFCPSCGYQINISRKMYEKYGRSLPTCFCGTKMALDCEEISVDN